MRDLQEYETLLGTMVPGIGGGTAERLLRKMKELGHLSPEGVRALFGDEASVEGRPCTCGGGNFGDGHDWTQFCG